MGTKEPAAGGLGEVCPQLWTLEHAAPRVDSTPRALRDLWKRGALRLVRVPGSRKLRVRPEELERVFAVDAQPIGRAAKTKAKAQLTAEEQIASVYR